MNQHDTEISVTKPNQMDIKVFKRKKIHRPIKYGVYSKNF